MLILLSFMEDFDDDNGTKESEQYGGIFVQNEIVYFIMIIFLTYLIIVFFF